jgi:hypothetical protein
MLQPIKVENHKQIHRRLFHSRLQRSILLERKKPVLLLPKGFYKKAMQI